VTQDVRDNLKSMATWAGVVGQWLTIAGLILVWLTGGIHPQTQTQYEDLNRQMGEVQRTLTTLTDKISAMPRPQDIMAQESHLSKLDEQIVSLGNRLTADEIRESAADARTQRLIDGTDTRARGPR
jgi:hypothetical protein